MAERTKDNFESTGDSRLTESDLINYMKGLPVLLFRIEMVKNRIEYLNDCNIAGLGEKSFLLLKNKNLSREVIFEEDHRQFDNFVQSMLDARAALTVVRIKLGDGDNGFRWLKLIGSPNAYNPGYYLGMIVDITDSIKLIEEMNRKEDEQQTMLELVDNPVILIDMRSQAIVSQNLAALELFGYSIDEFRRLEFDHILHPGFTTEKAEIFEEIIFEKKWKGKMFFRRKDNAGFFGQASLRSLKIKERRLLRISIHSFDFSAVHKKKTENLQKGEPQTESRKRYMDALLGKVSGLSEMGSILNVILKTPYSGRSFDGIIYSDIQIKKDRVIVYAAGETFRNLKFGESFSYEGTIAENIENYRLEHLIVEDTMSSIKAIDWALFIPHGIRSYFAKPFFERDSLRSILILCSREPNAFSEEKIPEYSLLDNAFIKGLKNWRKAQRNKKSSN